MRSDSTLDLITAFVHRLDDVGIREMDPYRRFGIAIFLGQHPEFTDFRVLECKVNRHHWCNTCWELVRPGYPYRHFFTANRHVLCAGFHLNLITPAGTVKMSKK
mmetsp:Transcript_10572/g.30116  ORF Transcript_10572/g.30116 Transcript_10572/m.30116 type:complete len:104 (+) Transcript_10572:426-737(+)